MTVVQVSDVWKQPEGMIRKSLRDKGMQWPSLVLAVARWRGRHYVCPRSSSTGGSAMSSRLTAMDIENQAFHTSFRGYDRGEVDLFLRSVAEEIERLNLEHGEMLEQVGQLREDLEELRAREQTLQKTLISAQRMTEEMKQRAGKESELLVQEARLRAERLLKDGQDRMARLEMDINRSKLERETFERRLRGVLEQHLALLDMRSDAQEGLDNLHVLPERRDSEAG
jgi:cell division initiation protein